MATFRPFSRSLPVLGIALLVAPLAAGCELFVHFDRSKIDQGGDTGTDGGGMDGGPRDGGTDGGIVGDAGMDAFVPVDANVDANIAPDVGDDAFHFDTGGGDAGCQGPSDCTPTGNECVIPTCDLGVCGTMNLGSSHIVAGQTAGDCHIVVCDGAGGTMTVNDDSDPPPATQCTTYTCNAGSVNASQEPDTTTCTMGGGSRCNGAGMCVECTMASHCAAASCVGNSFHAAETCSGAGACTAGSTTDCTLTSEVCNATAGCVECNTAAECAPASCAGTMFTPAETCSGAHACQAGTPVDCAATTQLCNPVAGCVDCNTTADCTTGTCNPSTHVCE